jgi:hypothetical protein
MLAVIEHDDDCAYEYEYEHEHEHEHEWARLAMDG